MFRKSLVVCLTLSVLAVSSTASAQSRTYSQALSAYFAGDYEIAEALLTVAIGDGSSDSRQYYFRGLARLENDQPDEAAADLTFAAELEASGRSRGGDVNRALEKVQGTARRTVEKYRREARRTAAIDAGYQKKAKALDGMYTEARGAYFSGDYERAGLLLDQIIEHETRDPRVYYYRGLCLEQLKRHEDAAEDFESAVQLELSPSNRINVDAALEKVQGDVRIALESHRRELLSTLRRQKRLEQQQMIAKLVQSRLGSVGAGSVSAAPSPGTVASTSPMPSPGPASVTPPPAAGTGTPTPPTPATTPVPTTTVNVASDPAIDLAWIPSDAELLVHVRVFEAWNSELLTPFHDNEDVQGTFAMMKAAAGVTVADIESLTAGVSDVTQLAQMAAVAGPAALQNPADKLVAVVRLRLPFDTQFLDAQTELFEKADHNGTSYYRALDEGETPCIYMPNLKTLVLADDGVLTGLIDDGPDAAPRPELAFVDATNQIVIAFVPADPTGLTDQIPEEPTGSPGGDALLAAIKGQLNGFSLGFGLTDSFTLEVRLLGADATAAGAMGTALGQVAQELAGMWQITKALAPEPVQPIVDTLLRSLKTSSQGNVAMVSTRMSAQSVQRAVADVGEMIPMLLAGGMMAAAGGGPPGLGPDDFGVPTPDPPMATRPATPVQITTKARVSEELDFDNEGNEQAKAIELVLDIVGDDAKAANAWGFPMLTAAKDNNGTDLTQRDRSLFASGAGFFQIDHDDFFVEHPEDGCQVAIAFDPPANMADSIASADGMIKLRVLADSESFEVADAASFIGKKLTDSKLTSAGFMLSMSEGEEDLGGGLKFKFWKLSWDNPDPKLIDQMADGGGLGLQSPLLVDAAGDVLQEFDSVEAMGAFGGGTASFAWTMTLDPDNPPPADAKLRFTLNKKVDYIDVKFSVQDVEITAAASN
jgi:tetratricopeptide (TPR) repeat protein